MDDKEFINEEEFKKLQYRKKIGKEYLDYSRKIRKSKNDKFPVITTSKNIKTIPKPKGPPNVSNLTITLNMDRDMNKNQICSPRSHSSRKSIQPISSPKDFRRRSHNKENLQSKEQYFNYLHDLQISNIIDTVI